MELQEFFREHSKVALAFSGGADSAYLLSEAVRCGADVAAYCVKSRFQPDFETEDAGKLAGELGAPLTVIPLDVLSEERIVSNPEDRCYFCKRAIFGAIRAAAEKDGYTVLIDGTNASDVFGDRPGMKVLAEEEILSPLRLCGLTKAEIRDRSRASGLFTWEKPAYACLATRIPAGERITAEKLDLIERSETFLFSLGFTDFRVRLRGDTALLQFPESQQEKAKRMMDRISEGLSVDFREIEIDPKARVSD